MDFGVLKERVRCPLLPSDWVERARVSAALRDFTIEPALVGIVAGPGYGKTLTAAEWARSQQKRAAWLSIAPSEGDAHSFLLYLRAAFWEIGWEDCWERFDGVLKQGVSGGRWRAALDAMLSLPFDSVWLVLDDFHHLENDALALCDYFLHFRPSGLGILLTSRRTPTVASWSRLAARGMARILGAEELAFQELDGLHPELLERSGGWPLALDLARRLQGAVLTGESQEILAREFWDALDSEEQELLERCAALDFLGVIECSQLCPDLPVESILSRLRRQGALVQAWSAEQLRLHPLFLEYLRRRLQRNQRRWMQIYQESAPLLLAQGQLLAQLPSSGVDIEGVARELLAQGAFERLSRWVEGLDPEQIGANLRALYAQALGASHRFEQALAQYTRLAQDSQGSERGRSLLEAGRLLVTTLQPQRAQHSLRKAYRLLPPEERPAVLELLAENSLNQGQARHARRLQRLALQRGSGGDDELFRIRLLLRTGQIEEARVLAESSASEHQEGHRDRELILAYLLILQGQAEQAESLCRRALRQARERSSTFSEAVALMRLGHALQLQKDSEETAVLRCYGEALGLADSTGATRLKAEALMGRALYHASRERVAESYQDALDGVELTQAAGDAWLTAWLRLCVAIAACLGQHPEADNQLANAQREMLAVNDRFGLVLVGLWRAVLMPEQLAEAARSAQEGGFGFLLQRTTFFAPRQLARQWTPEPVVEVAPLRICLLGPLKVYRQGSELPGQAFKRRKARELLGLLLAQRGQPLSKERLWDLLFPDSDADKAARDLRVALHALFDVLDPERPHNHPARWVTRRDDLYSIPWSPELSLDWRDFEYHLELAEKASSPDEAARHREQALQLVHGELLLDFASSDWALGLREGWRTAYLLAASRLAEHYLKRGQLDACLALAHAILEQEKCWEEGYRLLMRAHLAAGRAAQATRVYDLCSEVLRQELGVEPTAETEELYSQALDR